MVILSGGRLPVLVSPVLVQLLAAGTRPCGGGHHAAGVGQGGEEESCMHSALWIHTELCSFKSENKISKLVHG